MPELKISRYNFFATEYAKIVHKVKVLEGDRKCDMQW